MSYLSVNVGYNGSLPGLSVIGYRREINPAATPATREGVYVNEERRIVKLVDPRFHESRSSPVIGEIIGPPLFGQTLPKDVTGLGPWKARFDHQLLVIGSPEIFHAHELLKQLKREHLKSIKLLLASLIDPEIPVPDLTLKRQDALIVIYADRYFADLLLHLIRNAAESVMFQAHQKGDKVLLIKASWWLSRTATVRENDQDIYLAAAGLRAAGSPDWEILMEHGRAQHSEISQLTRLERATTRLTTGK